MFGFPDCGWSILLQYTGAGSSSHASPNHNSYFCQSTRVQSCSQMLELGGTGSAIVFFAGYIA